MDQQSVNGNTFSKKNTFEKNKIGCDSILEHLAWYSANDLTSLRTMNMAMIHSLPPQAYTRDVLVKAIDWVATQAPSVRERAMTADALVSLYLQARRRTSEWEHEAPVSGENFKSDLKHLAQDLKQFEESSAPPQGPPLHISEPVHAPIAEPMIRTVPNPQPPPPAPKAPSWNLDQRTLSAAREVQQRLNLSSEQEALRMLVTLGIERARSLFPS